MPRVVEKLTGGEPLSVDQLIEYLPALKEVPRAQLDNWAKGAAVLHRYKKGETVCEEGDFGSTAFYIVSGSVDIFIHNPLSHLRTRPAIGIFGRSVARMRSFLTDDKVNPRPERGARQLIGIDANVDLPIHKPLAQLGPGELFGEMTCRTYQPRLATVQARAVRHDRDVARYPRHAGGQQAGIGSDSGDFAGQGPHVKAHLLKLSWTKDIVKRVDPHRFSAAQLKHKRCCSGRVSRGRFAQRRILLTNMRDAQLEQSNSPQPLHAEVGSSMDHRFGTTPEITISRYANF
jgi:hypothetical protein